MYVSCDIVINSSPIDLFPSKRRTIAHCFIAQFVCIANKHGNFNSKDFIENKQFHSKYYQFHKLDDNVVPYKRGTAIYNEILNDNKEFRDFYEGSHANFPIRKVLTGME